MRQAGLVSRFEQAWSELAVNLNCGADYFASWIAMHTRILLAFARLRSRKSNSSFDLGIDTGVNLKQRSQTIRELRRE